MRSRLSPIWLVSQIVPPALLTYFGSAWWRCTTEVAPYVGETYGRAAGAMYRICTSALLIPVSILFLRLYFLPSSQSVPPLDPPTSIIQGRELFECLSTEEVQAVRLAKHKAAGSVATTPAGGRDDLEERVNRCWKGKCAGRWKPARARHCSECGVCRAGFDHHCAFFANCLTTPYIPCFLLTLLLTPVTVLGLCSPIFRPFGSRFMQAYRLSRSSTQFAWWWDWWPSWIVAGGPVGRYAGGVVLAWRELDGADRNGDGLLRLSNGVFIAVGLMLSLIAGGLAYTTITLIRSGHLTIDRERQKAHSRAVHAIDKLRAAGKPIPTELEQKLRRFANVRHFHVPIPDRPGHGQVVAILPQENPYDLGPKGNWQLIMGPGWGWISPFRAIQRGMGAEIYNWPLAPAVETRLLDEAQRVSDTSIDS